MKKTKIEEVDVVNRHVAQRLRKFRAEAGMSQKKLAQCAGISFQQIQKYESMKNRISIVRLFEFSQILNISIAAFFDGVGYRSVRCGFSDNSFVLDDDFYSINEIKEYLPLIKSYGKIESEEVRKNILDLTRNVSELMFNVEK